MSLPLRVATVADDADWAVLERVATGELHALDELYKRYKTMAHSIASVKSRMRLGLLAMRRVLTQDEPAGDDGTSMTGREAQTP